MAKKQSLPPSFLKNIQKKKDAAKKTAAKPTKSARGK